MKASGWLNLEDVDNKVNYNGQKLSVTGEAVFYKLFKVTITLFVTSKTEQSPFLRKSNFAGKV